MTTTSSLAHGRVETPQRSDYKSLHPFRVKGWAVFAEKFLKKGEEKLSFWRVREGERVIEKCKRKKNKSGSEFVGKGDFLFVVLHPLSSLRLHIVTIILFF